MDENKCFYVLKTIFKSKLVSVRTKLSLYKIIISPIALYACETWGMTKMGEKSLIIIERKSLRLIFGHKRDQNMEENESRTN